ncbi:hypothetical protein MOV08_41090 [Streptomyces yunnanensis]|uniref:Uncharacterized protein n=1 Tax=Streptomyces yunnanensis TaxID=156453 RepID=A0ABY8ALX2_9ACTN|nr:hypothetical protein [Streptomyces yunnanensis]WEB46089.1 hypothetical protein MOV08_41090 [Streptomyces yunnanensis]
MAANRLAAVGRSGVDVTVVNPRPDFVERIRLHEHAAGAPRAIRPLRGLLRPDVRLRVRRRTRSPSDPCGSTTAARSTSTICCTRWAARPPAA